MGAFTTTFMLLTLFTVVYGDDEALSLEVTIPDVMITFSTIDRMLKALQGPDTDAVGGGHSMAENLLTKVKWYLYGYFSKLIDMYQIRRNMKPNVEVGRGMIKLPLIKYPDNYLASRLKYVLNLKKKRDEQKVGK
ncbi:uncharacterized protein LOC111354102 [Spodoptera litura]|uniref:Uncharacterized protein LOC111354102 n=1 Tax=Spodoptera litura TaxID=69820 RepID=A0A9J7IQ11_SPOLT|nr:uncharacterized protein LOC111354102 [Spodoptera litura]